MDKTRGDFKSLDLELRRICKEEFQVIESKENKQLKETAINKITEIVNSWMTKVN